MPTQPFNFIDTETGEAIGYDYDIFAEICQRINCQPDFVETSWDAMVAVMGGEGSFDTFDVGADGITITEERAQECRLLRSLRHLCSSTPRRASMKIALPAQKILPPILI